MVKIMDTHICGACKAEINDLDEFIVHKKQTCPVLHCQKEVSQNQHDSDQLSKENETENSNYSCLQHISIPKTASEEILRKHSESNLPSNSLHISGNDDLPVTEIDNIQNEKCQQIQDSSIEQPEFVVANPCTEHELSEPGQNVDKKVAHHCTEHTSPSNKSRDLNQLQPESSDTNKLHEHAETSVQLCSSPTIETDIECASPEIKQKTKQDSISKSLVEDHYSDSDQNESKDLAEVSSHLDCASAESVVCTPPPGHEYIQSTLQDRLATDRIFCHNSSAWSVTRETSSTLHTGLINTSSSNIATEVTALNLMSPVMSTEVSPAISTIVPPVMTTESFPLKSSHLSTETT
ncbi:unnamed protein product [Mytilus coruscus]|uniref:Uncharacterized protein n=1 Tax=Mytilus coruscus TaxID=42192 RepID=A0A6J8CM81_MYTCO|nr:unnamed protein product [Mytilus coruscus]